MSDAIRIEHFTLQELQSYLGNVLNETLNLRYFEATLHAGIVTELERREDIEELKAERFSKGNIVLLGIFYFFIYFSPSKINNKCCYHPKLNNTSVKIALKI